MKYSVAIFTATILISCADVLHAQQAPQLYAVYTRHKVHSLYIFSYIVQRQSLSGFHLGGAGVNLPPKML